MTLMSYRTLFAAAVAATLLRGSSTPAADPSSAPPGIRRQSQDRIPASPLADDAESLRRVSLDLTGKIPTADVGERGAGRGGGRAQVVGFGVPIVANKAEPIAELF